jgi:hypothetical protein
MHGDHLQSRKEHRKVPPATTDLQHLHARLEQQLGSQVEHLPLLRFLERFIALGKIAAGILQVLVEE